MIKKFKHLTLFFVSIVVIQSCTKKETIIQEYKPPMPTLYGTWKLQNSSTTDLSSTYLIMSQNSDFVYYLQENEYGFRSSDGYAFSATDKQLSLGGSLFNYKTNGDTLTLIQSLNYVQKYIKVANPSFTSNTWTSNVSIIKSVVSPENVSSSYRSFGFSGNFLYFHRNTYQSRVYKFNTSNSTFADSINVSYKCSNYYNNGTTYYGFDGNYSLGKTTELTNNYTSVSTNTLNSIYSISKNATSNTFYTYTSNSELYAGTDGGSFTLVKNLDQYNIDCPVYYGSDEFLCINDGKLYKIKIAPSFNVTKSYSEIPNYRLYSLSTDGVDVWAYAYNNVADRYEYLKLNIN